jgi:SAM-dependent methyltransferase
MNPDAYREMANIEKRHWWFAGRRRIIESMLTRLKLPAGSNILEVGSGTGGNLEMLLKFGSVTAVEKHPWAVRYTQDRFGTNLRVLEGDFLDLAFAGEKFDLICAFDVLEHLPDDVAALRRMHQLLADNGRIILTVPAYRWLWSGHDERLHHCLRYARKELLAIFAAERFILRKRSLPFGLSLLAVLRKKRDP